MKNRGRPAIFAICGLLVLLSFVRAQSSGFYSATATQYRKQEYQIPMRDGIRLFTAIYTPRDTSRSYPILLHRTPYSVAPYGEDNYPDSLGPSLKLMREGFIFVYQDVRGRQMSEGEFVNMRPFATDQSDRSGAPTRDAKIIDEASDTYDTIEWLLRHVDNHNGKVGMWGISYPGFYAAAGLVNAHPALAAVSPQGPISDWFIGDDFHHNGAFFLAHAFGFLSSFGRPRSGPTPQTAPPFFFPVGDGYEFYLRMGALREANIRYLKNEIPFWNEIMAHDRYDEFWRSRNLRPHLKNIRPAVMTVGGWFDAEDLFGSLAVYRSIETSSPDAYNILVMGPWYHGAWSHAAGSYLGDIYLGSETPEFYRREIEYPFFMHFLKGSGELSLPEAYIFHTGNNQWRRYDEWPPRESRERRLYLCPGGKLTWDACAFSASEATAGDNAEQPRSVFSEYVSDPARPVPYMAGISMGMAREYMVADQRFAARRPDVLVFTSAPLEKDVTTSGPVGVELQVSTSGTDADFVVKLIDVFPDEPDTEHYAEVARMQGYQQLVRGEPFRGKFRNSFSRPEPFAPGEVAKIAFVMPDIAHTFRQGHRIMVQIQSSWFPLIDRNPQKFMAIADAKATDFQKATQRIYHSPLHSSWLTLRHTGATN